MNSLKYCCYRRRKKFKPNIPVVIHHDDGHIEVERVDLVQPSQEEHVQQQGESNDEQLLQELEDEESDMADVDENSTSLHYKKIEKKQKAWEDLRFEAIKRTFQFAGQVLASTCIECGTADSSFRCQDCAYDAKFCKECLIKMHTNINLYHNVEELRVCYHFLLCYMTLK